MIRAALLAALLSVTAAVAQDGCSQAAPCEWVVTVDADGFDREGADTLSFNGTVGDWYRFSILNADTVDHTIALDGYGSWTIAADAAILDTDAFELTEPGQFDLRDDPSGDVAMVQVFLEDVVDVEQDAGKAAQGGAGDAQGEGAPGFGLLVALVALALVARRR